MIMETRREWKGMRDVLDVQLDQSAMISLLALSERRSVFDAARDRLRLRQCHAVTRHEDIAVSNQDEDYSA